MKAKPLCLELDARRVLDALRLIVRDLRLAQTPMGTGSQLSAAQVFVLHVLRERGPLSVGDLAQLTATDPSSVSVVVRKLHGKGLVGKKASRDDRRRLKVALTLAGTKVAAAIPVPFQEVLMGRLAQLTGKQLGTLAGLLERVAEPMDTGGPVPMFFQDGDRRAKSRPRPDLLVQLK